MSWHVYEIGPIDNNWDKLSSVADQAEKLGAIEARFRAMSGEVFPFDPCIESFLSDWESAKQAALDNGWEGDARQPPAVFWLPDTRFAQFRCGFVVKQDNNGTTYVISPYELPHLAQG